MIASISGSGCWSARGGAWHATTRCATRWRGPTTSSTTQRRHCWSGVRCSRVDSTSKAPAQWPDWTTPTTTPFWICWTLWCASHYSSLTGLLGGPGFRCWRRSASSPRNNSSPVGRPTEVRAAHARYFAGREADIMALWDSPRQREAYTWFSVELANLRAAFRWAADHDDLDVAATIATYAAFLGPWVANYEPTAWAEELIEPARAVDHRRLAFLYVVASHVLDGRKDRDRRRLQRGWSEGSRLGKRGGAVRGRGLARGCLSGHRPARTVGPVVPRPAGTRAGHTHNDQGDPGDRAEPPSGAKTRRSSPLPV